MSKKKISTKKLLLVLSLLITSTILPNGVSSTAMAPAEATAMDPLSSTQLSITSDLYVSTRAVYSYDGESHTLVEPAKVIKVTPEGAVSTFHTFSSNPVGGLLLCCIAPDGYVAIDVSHDLALDASGNLFVAYSMFNRVDKITPEGTVTAFATDLVSPHSLVFKLPLPGWQGFQVYLPLVVKQ